jgi:ATP adenylyltransferase
MAMSEFNTNLWAPWRMEYIHSLAEENKDGCFLCKYRDRPGEDTANHVLWRSDHTFALMNRFPYTNGHLLIAPLEHEEDLTDLADAAFDDLWRQTRDAKALLARAMKPHGFNIGINFGLCAGAGLPGHVHVHVVPRWTGDTNFMAVLGGVRVVPESLDRMYARLLEACSSSGIPPRADGSSA